MMRHVDSTQVFLNRLIRGGRSRPERLAKTAPKKRKMDKAASCSMLDLFCNKRRRTLGWQPCPSPTTLSQSKMPANTLMQILSQTSAAQATVGGSLVNIMSSSSAENTSKLLQTLRRVTDILPCTDKATKDIVILAMTSNPMNLPIQMEGCTAVRRYVKATGWLDSESLSSLLLALINHSDLYLQYLVIDCIRVVSRDSKSRLLLAEQRGSMELILGALGSSPTDVRLQELGLSLLSYLVEESVCRKQILEQGGVNSIISAMKSHAQNSLVQCNGAAALCWLVHLEHSDAKAALLANPDAIQTIFDVCEQYVDNASVFGNCVCILCGVRVGDRSVQDSYPQLGTPARLLIQTGMRKNPDALKVQRNSIMLLRLVTESESETRTLSDADKTSYDDCITVVMDCMKHFPGEIDVQSLGCRVLANIAVNGEVKRLVVAKDGCINQVISALIKHKKDARVQQGAGWFLHGILRGGAGQEGPAAFGGGIAVLEIMLKGLGVDLNTTPNNLIF